jgi:hypothetical protein
MSMTQPQGLLRAVIAMAVIWFVTGFAVTTLASRLPDVLHHTGLVWDALALAASAHTGAVVLVSLAARPAVGRFGARRVTMLAAPGYGAAVLLPSYPTTFVFLAICFFVVGAFAALLVSTMTELARNVEAASVRSLMPRFELAFVAGLAGGSVASFAATALAEMEMGHHLGIAAGTIGAVAFGAAMLFPKAIVTRSGDLPRWSRLRGDRRRRLVAMWIPAYIVMCCQAGVVNAVSIRYHVVLGAGSLSVLGLACFVTALLAGLILSGPLIAWGEAWRVAPAGAALFLVGTAIAWNSESVSIASVCVGAAGFGLACVQRCLRRSARAGFGVVVLLASLVPVGDPMLIDRKGNAPEADVIRPEPQA